MHILHQVLAEDQELAAAVEQVSAATTENPQKHGLVLDLNPFWMAAYRLSLSGLDEELAYRLDPWFINGELLNSLTGQAQGYLNFGRRFKSADLLTNHFFGGRPGTPFLLRIFARPPESVADLDFREALIRAAREAPIPTIVETQQPATLVAGPGASITDQAGRRGTLGGFLSDDATGTTYAITCGHVIDRGLARTAEGPLGECTFASAPTPMPSGCCCTTGSQHANSLDAALVEVDPGSVSNIAEQIAVSVAPGDIVEMQGARSGHRRYEIGGAVVDHVVDGTCWEKLFLFHAPVSRGIFSTWFSVAATAPPAPGDSGAWLIRSDKEWAGMVVAANALHGFALAPSTILEECESRFGKHLVLA